MYSRLSNLHEGVSLPLKQRLGLTSKWVQGTMIWFGRQTAFLLLHDASKESSMTAFCVTMYNGLGERFMLHMFLHILSFSNKQNYTFWIGAITSIQLSSHSFHYTTLHRSTSEETCWLYILYLEQVWESLHATLLKCPTIRHMWTCFPHILDSNLLLTIIS